MPPLSQQKKDKIAEQILHYLFTLSPQSAFTVQVSKEIARDEEFTLFLLQDLKKKQLIIEINKNKEGKDYIKRRRWRLSNEVYTIYQKKQQTKPAFSERL